MYSSFTQINFSIPYSWFSLNRKCVRIRQELETNSEKYTGIQVKAGKFYAEGKDRMGKADGQNVPLYDTERAEVFKALRSKRILGASS
jgi:hypothetical protein